MVPARVGGISACRTRPHLSRRGIDADLHRGAGGFGEGHPANGVGGIGKSALAREYAYLFRREYLGGQFEIDLSAVHNAAGLRSQVVMLARGELRADISYALPEDAQFTLARAAFSRIPAGEQVLLILDNLNEEDAALVSRAGRNDHPGARRAPGQKRE